MKKTKIRYQIALSSFDGVSPQRDQMYDTKEEAQAWCDEHNKNDFSAPYARWIVIRKEYIA